MRAFHRLLSAAIVVMALTACSTDVGNQARAPGSGSGPSVLVVVAHPDDETALAATMYRIATELHGTVDELVVTNGEGGYRYSTLAEPYYGLRLTDEHVGRAHLPAIREEELRRATRILGVHELIMVRQQDLRFTHDPSEPLERIWDVPVIERALDQQLTRHHYDAVVGLLPVPETHGHHQAATILALRAVQRLPSGQRPLVFGVSTGTTSELPAYTPLRPYPETAPLAHAPSFHFDREHTFGFQDKLSYQIIVTWEIAEHKSQGTMQLAVGRHRFENFMLFDGSGPGAVERARTLFSAIAPWDHN